ncbi:SAM-dependent methyltransferase [Echinicola strongylocentroti]|uniref:SAM-dependent methyltransferase n=1 Tax=Echinicola strongylocentroti TaxID=1795355 RepID=A0A2Z4IL12_9BACT|nr:methyltransferase domain-containing protein [Echinicola strongylocentroti]AWW31791.1 SAM-dependent methyltransferase [Echinicola strongylocentroti]
MYPLLDENYWLSRYQQNEIGWDAGEATLPLKQYLDQLLDYRVEILIPGGGNAHEAAYAFDKGFENVHVLDIAKAPILQFRERHPEFPKAHLHHQNFFDHHGEYDLILEQTFFCALAPNLRNDYVNKMAQLLKPQGKLVGVLFDVDFGKEGPPFGGNKDLYEAVLSEGLELLMLEPCYNSIAARAGREFFFMAQRKDVT